MKFPYEESGLPPLAGALIIATWIVAPLSAALLVVGTRAAAQESGSSPAERVLRLFDARIEQPLLGHKPTGMLALDANADGVDELAVVSQVPGGLFYWRDLGAGFDFENLPRKLPLGEYGIGPVAFDAVRPAWIAAASQETGTVQLYDLGAEREGEVVWSRELAGTPTALAAGKLDGRDAPVLAVVTEAEELHLFDELGRELVHPLANQEGDYPTCLHVLQSGAGVIVGLQGSGAIELYSANGSGGATLELSQRVVLSGIPRDLCEADLDGDGDRELIVVGGDESVWVLGWKTPGGPTAALAAGVDSIVEWGAGAVPIDVESRDLDGDGTRELCVLNFHDSDVQVFDELLAAPPLIDEQRDLEPEERAGLLMEAGQTPWSMELGDFDGDGELDIATTNRDAHRVSFNLGKGDGSFTLAHRASCGRAPRGVATCDLDGDGYPDALALSAIDQGIAVLRSDGGTLRDGEPLVAPPATDGLLGADLDGDGHQDALYLASTARGGELVMLFGDGSGSLDLREGFEPRVIGTGVGDLWCGDLSGDGVNELVVSDPEGGRVVLFHGEGRAASFALGEPVEYAVDGGPAALSLFPAQGERGPRLCVGLEDTGHPLGVLFFDVQVDSLGGVKLEPSGSLPSPRRTGAIVCADFDADGGCDLALLGLGASDVSTGEIFVWRGRADGEFERAAVLMTSLAPYMIVAEDLDGDGRADLVAGAQHSHHISVWLSREREGRTPFLRLADLGVGRGPLDLCAADMDLDGRVDIIVGDHYSSSVSTLFNRKVMR